jgi:hypothetical protein
MSTVRDGVTIVKDPNDEAVYIFDWDSRLGEGVIIEDFSFITSGPDALLTLEEESLLSGSRSTQFRLTDGTAGRKYKVTNRIVTNEDPAQTLDAAFYVLIQE